MAAIRGGHTRPEMQIRRAMHAAGLRYRLHVRNLPGKPDLVFPKFRAVIFVNGCFWHGHDCHLFRWPVTRKEFWEAKIERNFANDDRTLTALLQGGWRIATVWECALKGKTRLDPEDAMKTLADWVKSDAEMLTVRGN
jgi:DNA mismatch endonuclease (patch repair protein)